MNTAEERRAALGALREEINGLTEVTEPTDEQRARLDAAVAEFKPLEEAVAADEVRSAEIRRIQASTTGSAPAYDQAPGQINKSDPFRADLRSQDRQEIRGHALRALEERGKELGVASEGLARAEKLIRSHSRDLDGDYIARRLLITESNAYRSAFTKLLASGGTQVWLTQEEGEALEEYRRNEYRVMNEGTGSAGGVGIPVLIDPTIILSSGAADAPLLGIATVKTITTNAWKGVASDGMTFAWDGESAVVADGSPTLAQPTVTAYKTDGFLPYTIELGMDYPDYQAEMAGVLNQGYLNILAISTMTGSGSSQPYGIFNKMADTTTNPAHVTVTTKGTLASADVRKVWKSLPERFRANATWVMNVDTENQIAALGSTTSLADFTVNLADADVTKLRGRPVVISDYAPAFTNTTANESALVVGDFRNFIVAQRVGMTVELVPHLFDTTSGRPNGQRGWYAYARIGHDVATANAFRVLANA